MLVAALGSLSFVHVLTQYRCTANSRCCLSLPPSRWANPVSAFQSQEIATSAEMRGHCPPDVTKPVGIQAPVDIPNELALTVADAFEPACIV